MGRVRILHISDLHERAEREKDSWRRRRVLGDAWLRHLDELVGEAPIDLLIFTGDAADWGKPAEFKRAAEFLRATMERLCLAPDRLFVIPGNHDVDRSVEPQAWKELRDAMMQTNDLLAVARWIGGDRAPPGFKSEWLELGPKRLAAYRKWVCEDLGRPELAGSPNTLGYRVAVELPEAGVPIQVCALNTAWLCGDDNDAGKLWILDDQLMRVAAAEGEPLPGIRLLLMHHPFDQMADGAQCRRLVKGHVDLVLRGHLHDEELETWSDPDRSVRQLAAGCLYEGWRGDQWPNACHVITLGPAAQSSEAEVRFRSWSARGGHWHDDNGLYEGAKNGRLNWKLAPPLPLPFRAKAAPAIPVNPWNPAVPPAFVGRDVLLKKLRGAWDQGRSVSLVGDWRIGKSSVLATCFESAQKSGRPVRLLNGESREGASPVEFVKAATGVETGTEPDAAADALAAWARQQRRPGLLPLLLVDECDVLVRRFDYRFFERLRGMLDDLCLGVSSRRELDRVFKDAGKGASPFQNRLELHWIGLLEPDSANQLIESAAEGLPVQSRSSIREWAGRHPFFIQLMARKLLDAREFGQTEEQVREEFMAEAAARLREVWSTLTEREQKTLLEASAIPKPNAAVLRRRGLLDEQGRPFGRVLQQWLTDECS